MGRDTCQSGIVSYVARRLGQEPPLSSQLTPLRGSLFPILLSDSADQNHATPQVRDACFSRRVRRERSGASARARALAAWARASPPGSIVLGAPGARLTSHPMQDPELEREEARCLINLIQAPARQSGLDRRAACARRRPLERTLDGATGLDSHHDWVRALISL